MKDSLFFTSCCRALACCLTGFVFFVDEFFASASAALHHTKELFRELNLKINSAIAHYSLLIPCFGNLHSDHSFLFVFQKPLLHGYMNMKKIHQALFVPRKNIENK